MSEYFSLEYRDFLGGYVLPFAVVPPPILRSTHGTLHRRKHIDRRLRGLLAFAIQKMDGCIQHYTSPRTRG
jgi:hypothetical protein